MTIQDGKKGRFWASGAEFVIVRSAGTTESWIRYRYERTEHKVEDVALRTLAQDIEDWGK